MTPNQAIVMIERSSGAASVFPPGADHAQIYRKLLGLMHPDRFHAPAEKKRAESAAQKLGAYYNSLNGNSAAHAVTIGRWTIESPLAAGDLADLYLVSEGASKGVLKVARCDDDNDLMEAGEKALRSARGGDAISYHRYLPEVLDTLQIDGRKAAVLEYPDGYLTLDSIQAQLSGAVPFRHVVWMMNRLLSLIGHLQRKRIVHGGITPSHLLFHPKTHGMKLVGWCSSVEADKAFVPIMSTEWADKGYYPPEVLRRWPADSATDIYMAAKCMIGATADRPARFRQLLEWCIAESPSARPSDAWELQDRWTHLAEGEYGKPQYIALELPTH